MALRLVKHVGMRGAVLVSVQPRNVREPPLKSQVAPTLTALRTQAGASIWVVLPALPLDAVTTALKQHPCFKEVQQRKVERTRDGSKVAFGLDIQVDCPNESEVPPQG